ncbi:hypothetical protein B0H19DRAFT_1079966 [Mycena capillaripes]|nr:hypothetical protein B0H19DRAFT_1079966 [Mycena capillaripes]
MSPKSIYSQLIYKRAPTGVDIDIQSTRFFKSFAGEKFKDAALAVIMARHPDFVSPTASIAKKCLKTLLPAMRFAMTTLDLDNPVPADICVFFNNLSTMIDTFLAAHPGEEEELISEYYGVPFPPWTKYPVFRADLELPKSRGPSDEDLEMCLPLNTSASRKRKGLSGSDSDSCVSSISKAPQPFPAFVQGISASNFLISLTVRQGNSSYQPKSNLGAGPGSSIPRLEYEGYKTLPVSEAIMPPWKCIPCSVLKEECAPHGLGVACACCVRKKLSAICDHSFDATDLANVAANFQEVSETVKPNAGPLGIPELQKLAKRAVDASNLAADIRSDFRQSLERFLRTAHKANSILGSDGLGSIYASDTTDSVRKAINSLFSRFNRTLDPTAKSAASDSKEDGEATNDDDTEMPPVQLEEDAGIQGNGGDESPSSPAANKGEEW